MDAIPNAVIADLRRRLRATDNEARSAALFEATMAGAAGLDDIACGRDLILATRVCWDDDFADQGAVLERDWSGVRIIAFPTRVTYPRDGVSHFKLVVDNIFITDMHVRLLFGMLWRLPALLFRRVKHRARKAAA